MRLAPTALRPAATPVDHIYHTKLNDYQLCYTSLVLFDLELRDLCQLSFLQSIFFSMTDVILVSFILQEEQGFDKGTKPTCAGFK
jgi:hypothetical protein